MRVYNALLRRCSSLFIFSLSPTHNIDTTHSHKIIVLSNLGLKTIITKILEIFEGIIRWFIKISSYYYPFKFTIFIFIFKFEYNIKPICQILKNIILNNFCSRWYPVPRENMPVLQITPRYPTIETDSPIAVCHVEGGSFGKYTTRSLVGQSKVIILKDYLLKNHRKETILR